MIVSEGESTLLDEYRVMNDSPMSESHKRALVVAYFLSRFDRKGIRALGFDTAVEAFEKLSSQLGVKTSTLKHMRDSFDPYCSQVRVGWHQRPILRSRANVIQAYEELSEAAIAEIVRQVLNNREEAVQQYTAPIGKEDSLTDMSLGENSAFANRLRTGETAETFFVENYPLIETFKGRKLEDTRKLGVGFDFRVSHHSGFQAVEVKGVREAHGYISFTDKEWSTAIAMRTDYILALVHSMDYKPELNLIPNPVERLDIKMRSIESVSVCWNARV